MVARVPDLTIHSANWYGILAISVWLIVEKGFRAIRLRYFLYAAPDLLGHSWKDGRISTFPLPSQLYGHHYRAVYKMNTTLAFDVIYLVERNSYAGEAKYNFYNLCIGCVIFRWFFCVTNRNFVYMHDLWQRSISIRITYVPISYQNIIIWIQMYL